MATYFTADQHLGHANIIQYCRRPFGSVEHMDEVLIQNHNRRVRPKDTVYILGDFTLRSRKWAMDYASRLHGTKLFIQGSHDSWMRGIGGGLIVERMYILPPLYTLELTDHPPIVLCHYPMLVWDRSHYGSWHLFGHQHNHSREVRRGLSLNVGVDCWSYQPISLDEVEEALR